MTTNIATLNQPSAPVAQQGIDMLDTERMQQMLEAAKMMSMARVTLPKHLQGSPGDCMAIIMQAGQWGMNPFAVAQKTHLVNGTLGYEAQLVNAVVSSSSLLATRIAYAWEGDWSKVNGKSDKDESRAVTVSATIRGEHEPRSLRISMAQVGDVRNSPLWVSDPRQQLAYLATKRWARLHAPDVLLGVYSVDELQEVPERDMGVAEVTEREAPQPKTRNASVRAALADRRKAEPDVPTVISLDAVLQQIETAESLEALQEAAKPAGALVSGKDKASARAAYKARKQALEQAAEPEAPDDGFTLEGQDESAPHMTFAEVMDRMQRAGNIDDLDTAADLIGEIADQKQREELGFAYEDLRAKMDS